MTVRLIHSWAAGCTVMGARPTGRGDAEATDWPEAIIDLPDDPKRAIALVGDVLDDTVFDATGDAIHSTVVVEKALRAGRRVVTMNAELHVTTGSYLAELGYLTEAEGDQPGALAALRNEAIAMGFEPMAFVNIKGFLDPNPTRESMIYWSKVQNLSLAETTSFTDGTKLHIEQALCANGLGAGIAAGGLIGGSVSDLAETDYLVDEARALGQPISDYVQCKNAPPGVFILARHKVQDTHPHYGPYEKLLTRDRRAYLLLRPFHLCALEVGKSLRAAASGASPLLSNGPVPYVGVAAVAKRDFSPGDGIDHPIGSFDVRGHAIRSADMPEHVPLALLAGARFRRRVGAGETVLFSDVDLPESRALEIWTNELFPRIRSRAA